MKGTCPQPFNFLLQLLKAKKGAKGCQKEHPLFLMTSDFVDNIVDIQ